MQKLDEMIARMRLLLADVTARENQLHQLIRQYHAQTEKILSFTLYGDSTLDTTLTMLSDVHDRLGQSEGTLGQLQLVRRRLEAELESLQLTKRIELLRSELTALRAEMSELTGDDAAHLEQRIQVLQGEINEASERAARTIGPRHTH